MNHVNKDTFDDLYRWSIEDLEGFWSAISKFCGLILSKDPDAILDHGRTMQEATFFKGATVNYAQNLLRRQDEGEALVFWGEDQVKRTLTFNALYDQVSQVAQYLKNLGLKPGDRVAGFVPNAPETVIYIC